MIYGSSAWSETSISSVKIQETSGEELGHILIIDTNFPAALFVSQNDDFSLSFVRELEFELDAD